MDGYDPGFRRDVEGEGLDNLAALFLDPVPLSGPVRAALLLPICLCIGVVYKTIKAPDVREIPKASLILWMTMVLGMWAVAFVLWVVYLLFA